MYASAGRVEQRMSGGVRPNGVEFGLERGGGARLFGDGLWQDRSKYPGVAD